jgi:alginate O-acetyltransferase complex protein AlgI
VYISSFPQLVAGPIVRYSEIAQQIKSRSSSWQRVLSGTELFVIGLAKKVIIADSLAVPVDYIFTLPSGELSFSLAWFGTICFALQIFFDFSGYSDMAIAIGRALGFDFPANFNQPYRSRTIREFWRRWHMTLSRWFRDYVYIPLGGNRLSTIRTHVNLLIVFILCGLWHGASWNFLVWGLIHGLFLVIERIGLERWLKQIWAPFAHFYTITVVLVAWVFFRSQDMATALTFLKTMIGVSSIPIIEGWGAVLNPFTIFICTLGIAVSLMPEQTGDWEERTENLWFPVIRYSFLAVAMLACVVLITSYSQKAFIYFRF